MSEILLKASEARDAATRVKDAATAATDEYESLKTFLSNLSDSFRGQTAVAFDEQYELWNTSAIQLNEALTGLGTFLGTAADQIEQLDTDLATNLRGG